MKMKCFALVSTLIFLLSCQQEEDEQPITIKSKEPERAIVQLSPSDNKKKNDWAYYISSHTSGVISKRAKITINFYSPMIDENKVGKPLLNVIQFTPKLKGRAVFTSPYVLEFTPETDLPAAQSINVELNPSTLKIPVSLPLFSFQLDVKKQALDISIKPIEVDLTGEYIIVRGHLKTSDYSDADSIERTLSAELLDKPQAIRWEHDYRGLNHIFEIEKLRREQKASGLKFKWNGQFLGVDDSGELTIELPAIGDFKITDISAEQGDKQSIIVTFSEPLSPTQNIEGLISIQGSDFTYRKVSNVISLYPRNPMNGDVTVQIHSGLKNKLHIPLGETTTKTITFLSEKPQVKFVGNGTILPKNDKLLIPFESVNINSVQVTALQVYQDNMGQFFQDNDYPEDSNIKRVGRILWRKSIPLNSVIEDKWQRSSLDASELLTKQPGALFRLTLSINRGNSIYSCSDVENSVPIIKEQPIRNQENYMGDTTSQWDNYEELNYSNQSRNWSDRNNPCKDAYYLYSKNVKSERNFIASNIGLLVKKGKDGSMTIVSTDIASGQPSSDVDVVIFNYQNQEIGHYRTNIDGFVNIKIDQVPFYIEAKKENQIGYLKLNDGNLLATSHFNVSGTTVNQGVKGEVYSERNVWRPGDNIYLVFVLSDPQNAIPDSHPVQMDLYNPKGQKVQTLINNNPLNDFYSFNLKTSEKDLTGRWNAVARLGGLTFNKPLSIETVMPNRLKIELPFEESQSFSNKKPIETQLFAQWLHGAKASRLKATIAAKLNSTKTQLKRFHDFHFDDVTRVFQSREQVIFDGELDKDGNAKVHYLMKNSGQPAGMLSLKLSTRVFEKTGGFSKQSTTKTFHPYEQYIGIRIPKGDSAREMLLTDTDHKVDIASVNSDGELISIDKIKVELFKIDWKWWWDKSSETLTKYTNGYYNEPLQSEIIETNEGLGSWTFSIKYPDWGRYLVRACDVVGKHCTSKIFYMDWPGWAGRGRAQKSASANQLSLSSDKLKYEVGEIATINMPKAFEGKVWVSVENGTRVIKEFWSDLNELSESVELPITHEMAPNIYVTATLFQPHKKKENDHPIRLYGILPLDVSDPSTVLSPLITTSEEYSPNSEVTISVNEQNDKPMTYTIAIVDEGLLGLTNFKTPDLHRKFYKKEALGVKSWDVFDEVVGAYGADLETQLALGGDGTNQSDQLEERQRRFPPIVKFMGPFEIKSTETGFHKVGIPHYLGAVRVMVVAANKSAYGSVSKSVPVKQALNILATAPRLVSTGEEFTVPVAVFASEKALGNVELSVTTSDLFDVVESKSQKVLFEKSGEKTAFIKLKAKNVAGKGKLNFVGKLGGMESIQSINLTVQENNPRTEEQVFFTLKANSTLETELKFDGIEGTEQVNLEASALPPINLSSRLNDLIRYPHGCLEQVTSSVFPQLYLKNFTSLDEEQQKKTQYFIEKGIERLSQYQMSNGGFAYWPGQSHAHEWATNYVGHFLLEAKKAGYWVSPTTLNQWKSFQKLKAEQWVTGDDLTQSYRLMTLSHAQSPAIGAMNRMRESTNLSEMAKWYLSVAYQKIGQEAAANELINNVPITVDGKYRSEDTLGRQLRNKAIILDALLSNGQTSRANQLVVDISSELSSKRWLDTHSTAFSLYAMNQYIQSNNSLIKPLSLHLKYDAGSKEIESIRPIVHRQLEPNAFLNNALTFENKMDYPIFLSIKIEGIAKAGTESDKNSGFVMTQEYYLSDGSEVDPSKVKQGQDLRIKTIMINQSGIDYKNLALTQRLPSGWEIRDDRLVRDDQGNTGINFKDIRDDRVMLYFDLKSGEKKEVITLVNASYLGRFYLPSVVLEAMYDDQHFAISKGRWIQVVP